MKVRNSATLSEMFLVKGKTIDGVKMISVSFSPNGSTAYAFEGFSDRVIAKAGGYGYDKQSTALCLAVSKLAGFSSPFPGAGAGIDTVIRNAGKMKIKIARVRDIAWKHF